MDYELHLLHLVKVDGWGWRRASSGRISLDMMMMITSHTLKILVVPKYASQMKSRTAVSPYIIFTKLKKHLRKCFSLIDRLKIYKENDVIFAARGSKWPTIKLSL